MASVGRVSQDRPRTGTTLRQRDTAFLAGASPSDAPLRYDCRIHAGPPPSQRSAPCSFLALVTWCSAVVRRVRTPSRVRVAGGPEPLGWANGAPLHVRMIDTLGRRLQGADKKDCWTLTQWRRGLMQAQGSIRQAASEPCSVPDTDHWMSPHFVVGLLVLPHPQACFKRTQLPSEQRFVSGWTMQSALV